MNETTSSPKEPDKPSTRKPMILFGILLFLEMCLVIYINFTGWGFGLQGWMYYYGSFASIVFVFCSFIPVIGLLSGHILTHLLFFISAIIQLYILERNKTSRLRLILLTIASIFLFLILSIFVVDPISEAFRTNKNIPQEITDHFSGLYGANGLKIVKMSENGDSWEFDHTSYRVSSPSLPTSISVRNDRFYGYTDSGEKTVKAYLEYQGQKYILDNETGTYLPEDKD